VWLLIALPTALTFAVLTYALTCLITPDIPCPRCHGRGVRHLPLGRTEIDCRTCHGRGHRLRAGARWWACVRTGGRTDELPDWID
jgi:DnaJ-class molecular chaperone